MKRLSLLLTIYMFSFARCAYAQQPSLYFDRITVQNGLSHNKVNCILQDKRGFIWIGTDDGLNRYDGSHFTIYRNTPGNSTTVSGNIISDLLEDEQQVLWIATADGGLTKYDYRLVPDSQFTQYKHLPGNSRSIPVNIINKLLQDTNGYLWLATSGHYVVRFNKKTATFESPVNKGTKTILALARSGANEIWAGKQGGGLLKINTHTLAFEMDSRYDDLYAKLPHATVSSLFTDRNNNIWYGSWDRVLYQYNRQLDKELVFEKANNEHGFNNDDIISFAEDKNGSIWMGGRYNGLHVYNPVSGSFYNFTYDPSRDGTVPGNQVNCVFIDRQGVIWAGTNKGIGKTAPVQQQFTQVFLPKTGSTQIAIYDFYQAENKDTWLATSEGIFIHKHNCKNFTQHRLVYKNNPLHVSKFYKDAAGRFFIGTNYSLFELNPQDFSIQLLPNTEKDPVMNQIIKSQVVSIAEDTLDGSPVLIVVPYGHYITYYLWKDKQWVSRLDANRQIVTRYNIKDNLVREVFTSAGTGALFIATAKEGLGRWMRDRQQFEFFKNDPTKKDALGNNNVFDMVEDKQRNLWLTTYGGGLHYFNTTTGKAKHVAASNNLLEGIETDRGGNIWMVSNGNIDKYNVAMQSYTSFPLPDIEKSGGVHGHIFKDREGKLYVAGNSYYIAFDPLLIVENNTQPAVFLTDFKIFNQSNSHLLSAGNISLPYNQNYIAIEFAAPAFSNSMPVQYQYKLTGLNASWIDIGTENKVSFSNLSGGTYEFSVRATNKPGVWYQNAAGIRITIIPPIWQRWWFYLLCAMAIIGIVYSVYRYRINEILKRQAIRNKIAQDLHDNIGSTLSSISVYSQVAKIYRQQQKDQQLQEALEKISETSSDMISEMSDIVWTINPRNDNMEVMMQRMQSFAKPLLATKSIALHFSYDAHISSLNPGMEQRKNFYLIFKEAVNNALKYAGCRNLYVTVKMKNHQLEMTVADDGIGFDTMNIRKKAAQSLSGNGLENILMRAKQMKGHCEIISAPGQGTTLQLRFPVP